MCYSLCMKEKVLVVIPARLNSTRLPRKMLARIQDKPLVWHTWSKAKKAKLADHVVVATDSKEIQEALLPCGIDVVMTPASIKTGSDRVAYAARLFKKFTPTIIVNLQGDEPAMPPAAIDHTIRLLMEDKKAVMSTIATPTTSPQDFRNPGVVKVTLRLDGSALYFSRSCIPYKRAATAQKIYKHFGIYGFRAGFLQTYVSLPRAPLEKTESLEQLRALEHGYPIMVGIGRYTHVEVNTRQELAAARKLITSRR